jgi:hypothetical protein
MRLRQPGLLVPFLMALAGLLACRQQAQRWRGRITHEGGITVVRNPATPTHGEEILTLEEELSIGRDDGPEDYVFSSISSLDVDDLGNIYAIDDADAEVRVFTKDGLFERTIGRKGQGPGEFERPVFVQITGEGDVVVGDYFGARMVHFSPTGGFVGQKLMPRPILPVRLDSQDCLLGLEILAPPPMGGRVIKKYGVDLSPLFVIASEETGERGTFDVGKPSCYCALTTNDHILWGDSRQYAIYEIDPKGTLVKMIIKNDTPRKIETTDRHRYEERYAEPLKAGMKIHFREHFPAFRDISTDDAGRILVQTYEPAIGREGNLWSDVFDANGVYIARTVIKGSSGGKVVWKKGKLYTVETSPEGFPQLKRYGVIWKD